MPGPDCLQETGGIQGGLRILHKPDQHFREAAIIGAEPEIPARLATGKYRSFGPTFFQTGQQWVPERAAGAMGADRPQCRPAPAIEPLSVRIPEAVRLTGLS